jgi:hypothetical protein
VEQLANHDSILVRVGEDLEEFYVPEKMLRANSALFDTVIESDKKEGRDCSVLLLETNPKTFKVWVKFLYTGRVEVIIGASDTYSWICFWALGNLLDDSGFKDALIDLLAFSTHLTKGWTGWAHGRQLVCTPDSAHRSLGKNLEADFIFQNYDKFNIRLKRSIDENAPWEGWNNALPEDWLDEIGTCKYHAHGPGKPCYKTMIECAIHDYLNRD